MSKSCCSIDNSKEKPQKGLEVLFLDLVRDHSSITSSEVGRWGGQMMMFDDKVGGWGWLNDDVSKKHTRKKKLWLHAQKKKVGKMNQN